MTDELYINGLKADIGPDTNIYTTYRSNLFGDLSKIKGNNTGTIKLPMTTNNIRILDACMHPASMSQKPFVSNYATVKRDGVDVISRASVNILKVTESSFEVALTWGPSNEIQKLLNTDMMLSDLDFDGTHIGEYVEWGRTDGDYYTPNADYGIRFDDDEAFAHPAVPISDVIDAIEQTFAISLHFDWENWYSSTRGYEWVIPLTQRNAEKISRTYNVTKHANSAEYGIQGKRDFSGEHFEFLTFWVQDDRDLEGGTWDTPHYAVAKYTEDRGQGESYVNYMVPKRRGITQTVKTSLTLRVLANTLNDAASVSLCLITWIGDSMSILMEAKQSSTPVSRGASGGKTIYEIRFNINEETSNESQLGEGVWSDGAFTNWAVRGPVELYSVNTGQTMQVIYSQKYVHPQGVNADIPQWWFGINVWYQTSISRYGAESGKYLIAPNMPKMKVVDFLKQLMQMCGKFAYIDEADGGKLKFASYSMIFSNLEESKTYDWSKYLIANREWIPSNMEFTVGDEAQINNFLYSDGSSITKEMNSYFNLHNTNLPETKDAVKLSFVDYDNVGNLARIPLYSYDYKTEDNEEEGGQVTVIDKKDFKPSDKPYMAVRYGSRGNYFINNIGIRWDELLTEYGKLSNDDEEPSESYLGMLDKAHVLTENFVLPPYVLNTLDITRPVYLKHYASWFAIIEIKTKANNIAEVKLIKLN